MYEQEDTYWWFVGRRTLALRLLKRFVPSGSKLLDVGCGTGAGLSAFAENYQTYGADFSDLALGFCQSRGIPRILRADAQKMPLAADQFDAVISLDTVEHIPDDGAAVAEIFRMLKPGGVFVINVPAYRWLWGPHDVALMHQRRYRRRDVVRLLQGAGFEVEWASYSVFFLFPLVVASRLIDRLMRREAAAELPKVSPLLNRILIRLQRLEGKIALACPLPWGSSIGAVARKPQR